MKMSPELSCSEWKNRATPYASMAYAISRERIAHFRFYNFCKPLRTNKQLPGKLTDKAAKLQIQQGIHQRVDTLSGSLA